MSVSPPVVCSPVPLPSSCPRVCQNSYGGSDLTWQEVPQTPAAVSDSMLSVGYSAWLLTNSHRFVSRLSSTRYVAFIAPAFYDYQNIKAWDSKYQQNTKQLLETLYMRFRVASGLSGDFPLWMNLVEFVRDWLCVLPAAFSPALVEERQNWPREFEGDTKDNIMDILSAALHNETVRSLSYSSMNCADWPAEPDAAAIAQAQTNAITSLCDKYTEKCLDRAAVLQYLLKSYRALVSVRTIFLNEALACVCFDWSDYPMQDLICSFILEDRITLQFPPDYQYQIEFWGSLQSRIEHFGHEVHEKIVNKNIELLKTHAKYSTNMGHENGNGNIPSYCTLTYSYNNVLNSSHLITDTITLRMERGFGSTTGTTLWPAGFFMSEYILDNPALFHGKRVHELGAGIGLTSIILSKVSPSFIIATDGDMRAVQNLTLNASINGLAVLHPFNQLLDQEQQAHWAQEKQGLIEAIDGAVPADTPLALNLSIGVNSVGLLSTALDWNNYRASDLDSYCADVIISCDTIYLPEAHRALAVLVRESLLRSASPATAVAYFCQVERSSDTFAHYLQTFDAEGLTVVDLDTASVNKRFDYDRQKVRMQRVHLKAAADPIEHEETPTPLSSASSLESLSSSSSPAQPPIRTEINISQDMEQ